VLDPSGAAAGTSRSARGGGWASLAGYGTVAYRGSDTPTDGRENGTGFRLVCPSE
jgi:formylglycine-generating enzyme required for sulfatase activity